VCRAPQRLRGPGNGSVGAGDELGERAKQAIVGVRPDEPGAALAGVEEDAGFDESADLLVHDRRRRVDRARDLGKAVSVGRVEQQQCEDLAQGVGPQERRQRRSRCSYSATISSFYANQGAAADVSEGGATMRACPSTEHPI
jgi:hypothetical protein